MLVKVASLYESQSVAAGTRAWDVPTFLAMCVSNNIELRPRYTGPENDR